MINPIVEKVLGSILENNKIKIPSWAERVKIDVGLSVNAPNSEKWLQKDSNLCVFGFEPNPFNFDFLYSGKKIWPVHLDVNRIDNSFFPIKSALSNFISEEINFYCTQGDGGTSSLFEPNTFGVKEITKTPVITLESFFELFPWEKISHIEQLKIDAQSSDYNIILGASHFLKEKVVYIDIETTTRNQYKNEEYPELIKTYLEEIGFECLLWDDNSTFINTNLSELKSTINYSILGE